MEQNLIFEIIDLLLKGESHARTAAKALNTNHMTVLRKIRRLMEDNVLDFRMEGRNKVYFIKKTVEAKNHVLAAEMHKLNKLLKAHPDMRRIVTKIQEDKNISLAVLFGSYARGAETKGSDIDIFIETENKELKEEVEKIDSRLSVKIGAYEKESLLIKEIEKSHVVIKGLEIYYEKNGFFD